MCSTLWLGKFAVTILKIISERIHILSIYRLTYSLKLRGFLKKYFRYVSKVVEEFVVEGFEKVPLNHI